MEIKTPASKAATAAAWDTYSHPPDMCPIEIRVAAAADAACRVNRAEVIAEVVEALRADYDGYASENAADFIERIFRVETEPAQGENES